MEGGFKAMRQILKRSAVVLALLVSALIQLAAGTALQSVVGASSAVVIAHINDAFLDGKSYHVQLRVVAPLKGTLLPETTVDAEFTPVGPRKAGIVSGVPQGNVLLAMTQDNQGSLHLAPLGPPALGLAAAYFTIPNQALAAASSLNGTPEANVAQVLAAAIEADSAQASRFLSFIQYSDASNIFNAWSASSSPRLKAYGLAARIAAQDASAIASVGATLGAITKGDASLLASALRGYRNPEPNGVKAVGKLATTPGADAQLILNCASALSAIHTIESVPYLAFLLDSTDHMVRQLAIGGLSSFVTNIRIAKDGLDSAEARDEVLNPGKQRTLPATDAPFETAATRTFLHFGPFKSDADETASVTFWKSWYQQNQGQF